LIARRACGRRCFRALLAGASLHGGAYKFVIFDVTAKVSRHVWQRAGASIAFDEEDWNRLPAACGLEPETHAESRDLIDAVHHAVDKKLTAKQRFVFAALLSGIPTDVLADQMGATHNAIYKVMFDARRKLRTALVAAGDLRERTSSEPRPSSTQIYSIVFALR
jgi:DNA-directed RNA polymerase specialized sigma24 family protein